MVQKRTILIVLGLIVVLGVSGLGLGLLRYGGTQGLMLRVRAEIGLEPTRAPFVPTPLSVPNLAPTSTRIASAVAPLTATHTPAPATATPTAAASATVLVETTATSTLTPTSTPSPTPAFGPAREAVALEGIRHEWQTWNNCGPATLAMYLSYYGSALTQDDVREIIRPNWEDKHASAYDMADYARTEGLNALVRINGDAERLRLLLSNDVPVMVATWHIDSKGEQMGHYRLLAGYDDSTREWLVWDSLEARGVSADKPYLGVHISYEELETYWPVYNRIYVVLYEDAQQSTVESIIGAEMDDATMWQNALARSQAWRDEEPENAFAWFTLGTNLLHNGLSEEAAAAYDQARIIGLPYRMMWYQFGALEAYYEVGRYDEVIALVDATINVTSDVEELHYWRGLALQAQGDLDGARAALQTALEKKSNYQAAHQALAALGE